MSTPQPADHARRLARYAAVFCLLTLLAAVLSFARGGWLGVPWLLMTGLSSNMAWYYHRRSRATTG